MGGYELLPSKESKSSFEVDGAVFGYKNLK